MSPESLFHFIALGFDTLVVDLLLSSDNAVIIAMACRSLPPAQQRRAMFAGTVAAIGLRVVLSAMAGWLLVLPGLKLIGGIVLTIIAIRLLVAEDDEAGQRGAHEHAGLAAAIGVIVVADLTMSVDNVIALAAVAQGNIAVLVLGLLLSVPLLMYGSWVVMSLLRQHPLLIPLGGAMLGWFAGDIAISDPLYAGWVATQAPVLGGLVPWLVALFVIVESRIIEKAAPGLVAMRPMRVAKRTAARASPPSVAAPVRAAAIPVAAIAAPSPEAQTPSVPRAEISRAPQRVSKRAVRVALAGSAAVAVLAFVVVAIPNTDHSDELLRFDCPAPQGTSIYYRRGGAQIVINAQSGSAAGIVSGNSIGWSDMAAARDRLGFAPPTSFSDVTDNSMKISGGRFDSTECIVHH